MIVFLSEYSLGNLSAPQYYLLTSDNNETVRVAGTVYSDQYVSPITATLSAGGGFNYQMITNATLTGTTNYHFNTIILVRLKMIQ